MANSWLCQHGHTWQPDQDALSATDVGAPVVCPQCGTTEIRPKVGPRTRDNFGDLPKTVAVSAQDDENRVAASVFNVKTVSKQTPNADRLRLEERVDARQTKEKPQATTDIYQRLGLRAPDIAGYEIGKQLGRGGMGVVYQARQLGLDRTVALKMLLGGAFAGEHERLRFQREARAVADIGHPNIVQIHEIGEQAGMPFFTMEFVEGGSLADIMHDTIWSPHDVARLVEQMARAVFAAHQKGIIHRDLKPANVLMATGDEADAASALPKITDFGLAKRLDQDDGLTHTGDVLGTPRYMSPEQAQGRTLEVGTATDIHALGAILYELLTGQPPYRGASVGDTIQQIINLEPVPPASRCPGVPRDLETICLKCLEKDVAKRYSTAEALADDLQRFLTDRPIMARRVPPWERAWKWSKRRPVAALLALVSCTALVLLLAGGLIAAARERSLRNAADVQRDSAIKEKHEADRQFQRAERNYQWAQLAVDNMLTRVGVEKMAHQPHLTKLRRELLVEALGFYQQFLQQRGPEETLRWDTAQAHLRVGYIQELLGNYRPAQMAYQSALKILVPLCAEHPRTKKYRLALGQGHAGVGMMRLVRNETAAALASISKARDVFAKLHQDYPPETEYRVALARANNALGNLHTRRDSHSLSAPLHYQRALALLEPLLSDRPKALHLEEAVRAHNNLAALRMPTDPVAALKHYDRAGKLGQQLVKLFPHVPEYRKELGRVYLNAAQLWQQKKSAAKTAQAYRKAQRVLQELTDQFPNVIDHRHLLATLFTNWSLWHRECREFVDAAEKCQHAQDHWRTLVDKAPNNPEFRQQLARNYHDQGIQFLQQQLGDDAELAFDDALEIQQQLVQQFPRHHVYWLDLAKTCLDRGIGFAKNDKEKRAEKDYRQCLVILDNHLVSPARLTADCHEVRVKGHTNLALLLVHLGREKEALVHWHKLISFYQRQVAAFPKQKQLRVQLAAHHRIVAELLAKQQDAARAAPHWAAAARLEKAVTANE